MAGIVNNSNNNNNNPNNNLAAEFEREVVYMECRRNHAASLGKLAFDGCCEFLGGGRKQDRDEDDDEDKAATRDDMLCAACNCHRNFHRHYTILSPIHAQAPPPPAGGGGSDVEGAMVVKSGNNNEGVEGSSRRNKRKRTVFSAEQKRRMTSFAAERLQGWKAKKQNKDEIDRFCLQLGITRKIFLVWLSNNRRHHRTDQTE